MQQNYEQLLVREENGTVIITINRPEALNALNATVLQSLSSVLAWLVGDSTKREMAKQAHSLILTGAGEKAFVAGADIKQFENMSAADAVEFARRGQQVFMQLEKLKIPVIAAVNGFALGGGLELALACDFIYAAETARFALPECTLGLMPGFGGTVRLPRRIGPARALEMSMTGTMYSAAEAMQMGLVNKVLPAADLLRACLETLQVVGSRGPLAIGQIKKSIHQGMSMGEEEANHLEAKLFGELFSSEDKIEGVSAFLAKRKPVFSGK